MTIPFGVIQSGRVPPAPAPSCSITLTTSYNSSFGINDAQIDGQRVFVDSVNDEDFRGATTDVQNPTAFWSSGTRWIEAQDVSETASKPQVAFVEPSGDRLFKVVWTPATSAPHGQDSWEFSIVEPVGTTISENYVNGSINDNVAIGVSSNGDCRAVVNNTEIDLSSTQDSSSGTLAEFYGFWSGDVFLLGAIDSDGSGTTPRSGSVTIATDGSNYNNDFSGISGTNQDWCGNTIPAPSCAFPLDASESEITSAGIDGKLTPSNNDYTGSYAVQSQLGSNESHAMAPDGFLSGSGRIDVSSGIVAGALSPEQVPVSGTTKDVVLILRFRDGGSLTSIVGGVAIEQLSGGYEVYNAANLASIASGLSSIDQVGVYFDASAGQWGVSVDSTDYGFQGSYTASNVVPTLEVSESKSVDGTRSGDVYKGTWVSRAADITATMPSNTEDPCGNTI